MANKMTQTELNILETLLTKLLSENPDLKPILIELSSLVNNIYDVKSE